MVLWEPIHLSCTVNKYFLELRNHHCYKNHAIK